MAVKPRHLLPAAVLALVAVVAAWTLAVATTEASAAGRHRTALAAARAVPTPSTSCARPLSDRRARNLSRWQRRREIHGRLGNCAATQSRAPSAPLYWGATIGDQITGEQAPWDMGAVNQFEAMAGKGVSLVNFFSPFANCGGSGSCSFYKFPTGPMDDIRSHGSIPVFSWSSQSIPSTKDEPDFQLADVISGRYDSYIREFAEDAKQWGHPFFLRFDWEMNGNWFPWSEGVNGNQAGEFVSAWRHVHDIFTSVGATNATWVWCPNVDPENSLTDLASDYPGDEYVDWTGLDGYNWGPSKGGWTTFSKLYRSTYDRITNSVAPSKPLLIGEMGSTENGGSKAGWIAEALEDIPTEFPQVRGILWFDSYDDGMDWPIETSSSATNAFAAGVKASAYEANSYAGLSTPKIAPPS